MNQTLTDINLAEISPTPFPAYESSEVNQRSKEQFGITTKEQLKLNRIEVFFHSGMFFTKRMSNKSSHDFRVNSGINYKKEGCLLVKNTLVKNTGTHRFKN